MAKTIASPIFIVGYMHSGTTLLKDILSNHPSIFSGRGETKLFEFYENICLRYQDIHNETVRSHYLSFLIDVVQHGFSMQFWAQDFQKNVNNEYFEPISKKINAVSEQKMGHGEMIPLVFDYFTEISKKTRWLEKTPTHIYHIDLIKKIIPDAVFIEIVRDPRAVLSSKKVRREFVLSDQVTEDKKRYKRLEKAYDPIWDLLSWKSAIRAGIDAEQKYGNGYYRIHYEALVKNPDVVIEEICHKLDLQFSSEMLEVITKNTAYVDDLPNRGISTKYLDRWQSELNDAEKLIIHWLANSEMHRNKYINKDKINYLAVIFIPLILVRSFIKLANRLYRRFLMGGFGFFKRVLISYFQRFAILIRSDKK